MARMTDDQILQNCTHAIEEGRSWNEQFHDDRRRAMDYYLGRPFGDEREDRDKTVLSDVHDAIEWTIPTLLRIFTSGANIVSFQPQTKEDEKAADQESKYCDWVFWDQNDGFTLLYNWFKDALLLKIGVVKVWWAEEDHIEVEKYFDQPPESLAHFRADDDVEVTNVEIKRKVVNDPDTLDPVATEVFDIELRRFSRRDKVKIEPMHVDEFRTSPLSRDVDTAPFNIHSYQITRSKLIEMGFDRKEVMDIHGIENDTGRLSAHEHRGGRAQGSFTGNAARQSGVIDDPSMVEVTVHECYIRMDIDDDGKAELMQVFVADNEILGVPEEWPGSMPFVVISPIPMPHEVIGRSWADQVIPLQNARSQILRNMIDNMYRTNNVRYELPDAITGVDTVDDIFNDTPGGIIRTEGMGGILPLSPPVTWQHGQAVLAFLGEEESKRIGQNAFNMGMVPDTAESGRTAAGSMAFRKAANQRNDTVARIFGEGLRRLYLKIHELARRFQDTETILKLNGEYIPMDPSNWQTRTQATCRVGMGAMDVDEQMSAMNGVFQMLLSFTQHPNPVVQNMAQPENLFGLAKEIMELSTIQAPERFITSAEEAAQLAQQQQQQNQQSQQEQMQQQLQMQQMVMQAQAQVDVMIEQAKAQAKSEAEVMRIGHQTQSDLVEGDAEHGQELEENQQLHEFKLVEQAQKIAGEENKQEFDAAIQQLIGVE